MRFLDPSQASTDLPAGSEIELPIWAARVLSKQKRAFISIKMPKFYGEGYREVLKADPTVVDLNKMGPQYYQSALQMCTLPSAEMEKISDSLPDILQKRVIAMADSYSLHRDVKSTDEVSNQMGNMLKFHHMDPLELQIFNDSKAASEDLDDWLKV
ncbi:DNA replication complex GINS protein PSF3 [Orchesella cincta]|uniref:DNA replication complex GINS protein PSF3 n=1 Tax=Orchesella cincta TaxID=48709 RepID=A0A1D2NDU2_ORCCI|nr:DNA replication complex GINS protein PSF3 [Orchesella cincta]